MCTSYFMGSIDRGIEEGTTKPYPSYEKGRLEKGLTGKDLAAYKLSYYAKSKKPQLASNPAPVSPNLTPTGNMGMGGSSRVVSSGSPGSVVNRRRTY